MLSKQYINLKYGLRSLGCFLLFVATVIVGDWFYRSVLENNIRGQALVYAVIFITFMVFMTSLGHWYIKLNRRC